MLCECNNFFINHIFSENIWAIHVIYLPLKISQSKKSKTYVVTTLCQKNSKFPIDKKINIELLMLLCLLTAYCFSTRYFHMLLQ